MECCKIWAERKVDFNRLNKLNETSILIGLRYRNKEIVRYLLENIKSDYSVRNVSGKGILEYVSYYKNDEEMFGIVFDHFLKLREYEMVTSEFHKLIPDQTYLEYFLRLVKNESVDLKALFGSFDEQSLLPFYQFTKDL